MESQETTQYNREYKDRLFKYIFGKDTEDSKKWRLQLYNALNGTNITDPDALKINTIENVIYISMHNDISFLVDTEINLYEEQSSWNPNMPLRGFLYFSILYQLYLKDNNLSILSRHKVMIPRPRFFVFYHGKKTDPDTWKLKLSDSFLGNQKEHGDFEWTATIINLRPDENVPLNKNCTPLYHYVKFVSMVSSNMDAGMDKNKAIEEAVDEAIKEKLLDNFFKINKAEVIGMCLTEFDEELAKRTWRNDGYIDGRSEKAKEAAINLLKMNILSPEQIAQAAGLSLEEVLELQKSILVKA
ncbi:hypothetical protein SAMN04487977_105130 [Treponema bryantii]|uniref:Transposase, YhgA-like n=1 Tax=Treponema bryantii TaxID=163 RepID=A0A1H9GTF0_9SPIR|nr:hypothetical protein [Treponema bryantii]BDC94569.1 hypothetical protein TRBR_26660 [Treponema bryantii]SEQ53269.1 hypothetical protein SAMN04487977_105130 [Treponema bryantii]